jgi:hypothetical protein
MLELELIGFGIYSVGLVYLGWYEGRKSKWAEQYGVPPVNLQQQSEDETPEPFEASRNQPRSLTTD